jgi:hypothetical protein
MLPLGFVSHHSQRGALAKPLVDETVFCFSYDNNQRLQLFPYSSPISWQEAASSVNHAQHLRWFAAQLSGVHILYWT